MRFLCSLVLLAHLAVVLPAQSLTTDSLLNILPKTRNDHERVNVLNALAFHFATLSIQQAEKYVEEAIALSRQSDYKLGLAEAYKVLSLISYVRSEYTLALEYSYQALRRFEELDHTKGVSRVYNNLALILMAQKEFGRAMDFTTQSLKIKQQNGDSLGVGNSLLALAQITSHYGHYERSRQLTARALAIFEKVNDSGGMGYAYYTLGHIAQAEHQYHLASAHYRKALDFIKLIRNDFELINITNQQGKLFLASRVLDSAYHYLRKTLALAKLKNFRHNELEANENLAEYFWLRGQIDSSLYYTRKAASLEKEIYANDKHEQIQTYQKLKEFEKTDQELTFQKQLVRRQFVAIAGVTLILLLVITFGFRLYSLYRANQRANEELLRLNHEINTINTSLEKVVSERTEELRLQNIKLMEYAYFNAHEVRGPLARILGLIELAKIKELTEDDRSQIMVRLEDAATQLDDIIRSINRKLEKS